MTATLSQMRTSIAYHLQITAGTELATAAMDDAVEKAVSEMSRYVPRLLSEEIHFELDVSAESFTSSDDTEVALANNLIQKDSESVTLASDGTAFSRDTDYEMDYINGRIKTIGSGSISNGVSCRITYKRSQIFLSTSSLLTDPISIIAVEYPIDEVPMSWCSFEWHGDILVLRTKGNASQSRIADEDEVRIWYASEWAAPGESATGLFPEYLDEVVIQGAAGYCQQMLARKNEQAGVTALALSSTAAAASDDDQSAIDTALTAAIAATALISTALGDISGSSSRPVELAAEAMDLARTQLALSNTALDTITSDAAAVKTALASSASRIVLAAAEFAKVSTYGEANALGHINEMDDYMTGGTNGAKVPLDLIQAELDLANLALDKVPTHAGTEADAALDKVATHAGTEADTALDKVDVHITTDAETALDQVAVWAAGGTDSVKKALGDADGTPYADINTALDKVAAELQTATRNADDFLNSGDGLINTINTGAEPSVVFARYADTKINMARTYAEEAIARIQEMGSLTSIADVRLGTVNAYIAEAAGRINMSNGFLGEAQQRIGQATAFATEAGQRVSMATAFVNEAAGRVAMVQSYISEAGTRLEIAQGFGSQADRQLIIAQRCIDNGMGYVAAASQYIAEAQGRLGIMAAFANEAAGRQGEAQAYITEASVQVQNGQLIIAKADGFRTVADSYFTEVNTRLNMEGRYIRQAETYQGTASAYSNVANLMRVEANETIARFKQVLEHRQQVLNQKSIAATIQWQ